MNSFLKVFQSRKIAALLLLGFASGLPLNLSGETLKAWMTQEGVDLGSIGFFSLVALPYSFKVFWAPILDRYVPPFLGRRRGWLVVMQILLMVAIAAMSLQNPKQALQWVAFNAVLLAFLSATQDIAGDAYRTDVLEETEMGAGAAVWALGYRGAMLLTAAIALTLANYLPWSIVYLLLAGLMGMSVLFTLFAPEPRQSEQPPNTLMAAVYLPFKEFFERLGTLRAIAILVFVILYRLSDFVVNNIATPFLLKAGLGFSLVEVGVIRGGMGLIATIVGGLLGGAILSRIGINRSLWVFGGLQALSNLAYYVLAIVGKNTTAMVLAINIENFCGGLGTTGFLAFLMSLCNPRFSATQFALLTSLMAIGRDVIASPSGQIAKTTGWSTFFLISIAAALPGLLLLPIFAPWNSRGESIDRPGSNGE